MKPLIFWSILAMLLMIGCPWLAATFAGSAGMAVCLLLFFGVNPIFSAVCGVFAGKDIKRLWPLPIVVAGLFLAGAWLFFAMGETAFLLYCVCYLMIALIAMLMRSFLKGRSA
uniref:hypothetical protein n=1 Tax=Dysosmobacter welbionis TaxID=2093857 RepID=UPI003FEF812D